MPVPLLVILMAGTLVFLARASVRQALPVLLGITLLVPDTLRFPSTSSYLTFHRLTLLAFAVNLTYRFVRRRLDIELLKPTPVHVVFVGFIALAFTIGVGLGDRRISPTVSVFLWMHFLDSFVFFAALVIAIRAVAEPLWVARVVAALVAIAAAIAVVEHFTHWSYGRWILAGLTVPEVLPGSFALEPRGGDVRVRAAAQFALAYAWIAAALLPVVVAVASRVRRLLLAAGLPALVVASIVWTYSRSVYAGLALGAMVLVASSRLDVRASLLVGAGTVVMLLIVGGSLLLFRTFRAPDVPGSDITREERLPVVLEAAAQRPWTGLGFTSLEGLGFGGTDASYVHIYVEIGVAGLVGFAMLIGSVAATAAPAVRAPPGAERALGAAAIAGLSVAVLGAAFHDTFTVPGAGRVFWLLAALAVVVAERAKRAVLPGRARRRLAPRAALPLVGVGAGFLLLTIAPRAAAVTVRFTTFSTYQEAFSTGSQEFVGRALVTSACTAIEATRYPTGADIECFDLRTSDGVGEVRIRSATVKAAERDARTAMRAARQAVRSVRAHAVGDTRIVQPTWARTAPLWAAAAGLALAAMIPALRPRRRRAEPVALDDRGPASDVDDVSR